MLILDAEIRHDLPEENEDALTNDLDTSYILRPSINFGNGYLFSGELVVSKNVSLLKRGEWYRVLVQMPTINNEAWEHIKDLVGIDNIFFIQIGGRILGKGKIIDFVYDI